MMRGRVAAEGGRTGRWGRVWTEQVRLAVVRMVRKNTAVCQRSVLPVRPNAVLESGVPMLLSGWHRTCHCSFESGISHVEISGLVP